MAYKLKFLPSALKEWKKLDYNNKESLKKKLKERLIEPRVPSSKLRNFTNHYKIKLKASGYRLVYKVVDKEVYILVIAIGKRDRSLVYKKAKKRAN